jgi:hypothetical protein
MLNNIHDLLLASVKQSKEEPYHEVLEYVSLDGSQYFNPDLLTDSEYTIEARFKLTDTTSSSSIFGGRNSSANPMNGNQLHYIYTSGKTQYIGGYSNAELAVENAITVNDLCEVVCDKTGFSIAKNGGTPTKYSREFSTIQYTTDLMLCATYTKIGDSTQWGFRGEIYVFRIFKSGVLIRDYVPVLDGKMQPCLYDRVNKTFLYAKKISDGSTTYDLGFKRWNKYDVDYISFTGTQYIDLGLTASYTSLDKAPVCEFEGKIDTLPSSTTTMQRFVSAGGSGTGEKYYQIFINWNSSGTPKIPIGFQCGAASPYMEAREADTNWHYYKYDIPNKEAFIDDTSYDMTSYTSTSVSIPYNLYIGARNLSGEADRFLIGSLKYLKWSIGGQLIRDFKPVVWHNADVTAEACLYDEVYNKMYQNAGTGSFNAYIEKDINYTLMSYTYMNTHGYYISERGVVTAQAESDYTDAIAVQQGDIVTLTTTTTSRVSNKRIHGYNGTSTSDWVSQLGAIEYSQTGGDTRTLSVVVPSGVTYIRVSHSIYGETQCDLTITRTYEVGTYLQTLKTSTIQSAGYMVDLDIEPKDGIGYHIKTSTNSNSSNYVFGARKFTSVPSQQSTKPILIGLTGSQTGATILSSVMGESATWKSDGTNWIRPSSSTSSYAYECSLQTYKENNELKFNIIGYNYTLAKNADRQTLTYTDAIDNADEADISTLRIGGLNANNILNGNNAYFFIKCRQPDMNMTLLPVVNNNQFYFIDNKTKQTYQFYKVGSPTPTTDNIRLKKLDGTFINGTL